MTTTEAPAYGNGFLIPGRECECDVDARCDNHDTAAEEAYWLGQLRAAPAAVVIDAEELRLAYEPGDPKLVLLENELT